MKADKTRIILKIKFGKNIPIEVLEELEELENLAETKMVTENKPIKVTKSPYNIAFCPKCNGSVWQNKDESKFCFRCGQKISW